MNRALLRTRRFCLSVKILVDILLLYGELESSSSIFPSRQLRFFTLFSRTVTFVQTYNFIFQRCESEEKKILKIDEQKLVKADRHIYYRFGRAKKKKIHFLRSSYFDHFEKLIAVSVQSLYYVDEVFDNISFADAVKLNSLVFSCGCFHYNDGRRRTIIF